jgi:HK97 family phage major capsid protein
VLEAAFLESITLRLGNRQVMASGLESVPVVSFMPVAGFVNPAYGGRKPATKIEWSALNITAEEIACVLAVPTAFIDDAGAPLWDNVKPAMASAIAKALDDAVLFGTGAPASFPTGGLAAIAGAALTGATATEAIDKAAAAVEASGAIVDGIAGGPNVYAALRAAWGAVMASPDQAAPLNLYGWPVAVTSAWDSTKGDALVGAWEYLLVGVREDITFDVSTEAILQDNTGAIIANMFQDNLTGMKCYMRVGVAVGTPLNAKGTAISPFKLADWTA